MPACLRAPVRGAGHSRPPWSTQVRLFKRKLRKKIYMKLSQLTLLLLVALGSTAAHAQSTAVPLFGNSFNDLTVFGQTYVTTGANSTVIGDMLSGGVTTTGAHSLVGGSLYANGAATIGANARVAGNMVSVGAGSTGDTSSVGGYLRTGGAATVGANAEVIGKVESMGAIALSASSRTNGVDTLSAVPVLPGMPAGVLAQSQQLGNAQAALNGMGTGTALATTMIADTTLYAGVFSAANLSTTAGITLTLDGQNKGNQAWVFNINDYLVAGASTKIVLINSDGSDRVIWNSGGYASLGAGAAFLGTVLARDYISVGANASVAGLGGGCGGVFSATSYVSTGDGASIGASGCKALDSGFSIVNGAAVYSSNLSAVPEPASGMMLVAGLALLGLLRYRKRMPV